jgi:hypothetical protein
MVSLIQGNLDMQSPHRVRGEDLPPSFSKRALLSTRKGFKTTLKAGKTAAVETGKFFRRNIGDIIFLGILIGGPIGGGWIMNKMDPVETNIKKFNTFVQNYSVKTDKKTFFADSSGNSKLYEIEVNGKDYYMYTANVDSSTVVKFNVALEKSKMDVKQKGEVSVKEVVEDTTKNNVIWPTGFWTNDYNGTPKNLMKLQFTKNGERNIQLVAIDNEADGFGFKRKIIDLLELGYKVEFRPCTQEEVKFAVDLGVNMTKIERYGIEKIDFKSQKFFARFSIWVGAVIGFVVSVLIIGKFVDE